MDLDGIYYGEGLTLLLLTGVAWSEMLEDVHLSRKHPGRCSHHNSRLLVGQDIQKGLANAGCIDRNR